MGLKIEIRSSEGVTILDLRGEIILGDESKKLRGLLKDLIAGGNRKVLLNLVDVSFMDTTGLGVLVRAYGEMNSLVGQLKLLNLTKRVHDLMQITKLYTVFDIFDSEEEAIKSF